jgi:hypothetical protein
MPGTAKGAAKNPWINHLRRSYVSPYQRLEISMVSGDSSGTNLQGMGTSSGQGACTVDAGIVKKLTSYSCESSCGGGEPGFQQTQ